MKTQNGNGMQRHYGDGGNLGSHSSWHGSHAFGGDHMAKESYLSYTKNTLAWVNNKTMLFKMIKNANVVILEHARQCIQVNVFILVHACWCIHVGACWCKHVGMCVLMRACWCMFVCTLLYASVFAHCWVDAGAFVCLGACILVHACLLVWVCLFMHAY